MTAEKRVLFTAADASLWGGGLLVGSPDTEVFSVDVDSRRCGQGTLFVALKGERADGHDYVSSVFGSGAAGAVVSKKWYESFSGEARLHPENGFLLVVDEPLLALQKISASYMKKIKKPVKIGVTGSNGKTTTKELIAAVLARKFNVVKTEGNFNSEIGLPLTVFNIDNSYDYAVVEMGVNRMGEMDVLAEILRPDLVVITNIGTAHIGIFKNMETIAAEKRRSVSFFNAENTLFVSEAEDFFDFLDSGHPGKTIKYGPEIFGSENEGFSCSERGLKGWRIVFNGTQIDFPLIGRHNLENAVCACTLGRFLGVDDSGLKAGLESINIISGRSEIIEGPVTIIQDCYNANADSVGKAILFADELEWDGRKIYVLGDMKELGEASAEIHRGIGLSAANSSANRIYFYGPDSIEAYNSAQSSGTADCFHTEDYEDLKSMLLEDLGRGDLLLLKGSRSMSLERLLEPVKALFMEGSC